MRNTLFAALFTTLIAVAAAAAPRAEGLWYGLLPAGAKQLRVAIRIAPAEGELMGTFNSLDQSTGELPLDEVRFAEGALRFALHRVKGSFEGVIEGDKLTGVWNQRGLSIPFSLDRVEAIPVAKRPQEPVRPFPYDELEVVVEHPKAGVKLGGTLTMPRRPAPFPAVVLVSGSGPQDRDETVFGHRPFLVLADDLTRRGIAVLRVDDRGVGASSGERTGATTDDYAGDVLACVEFLRSRKEIDPKRIGLVGHSEGGMIAPLVASRSDEVAFIVLLAAPGLPGEELVHLQSQTMLASMGASAAQLAEFGALQRKVIALTRDTADEAILRWKLREVMTDAVSKASDEARPMYANIEQMVEAQVKRLNSPWYRWMLAYDPAPVLRRVRVPLLAINGSKDIQVTPKENLSAIARAASQARVVELPGLNHLLQTAPTGALTEYAAIEETMAPAALRAIGEWIVEQVR